MRVPRASRVVRRGTSAALAAALLASALRAAAAEDAPPAASSETAISAFRFGTDDRVRRTIDLARIRKGIPKPDPRDGIPAIRRPESVAAAAADFLRDEDAVIGLEAGGEARAYAVRFLDVHEVANDLLGGIPVAMTYCPLCDSGVAFRRDLDRDPRGSKRVDEPPLEFGISGYLYDSDVLLYDRASESFWQQFTATAVVGPLTGVRLETLPAVRTTWKAWRARHPETTALSWRTEHGFPVEAYVRPHYAEYRASKQPMFPVEEEDARLPKKATVYGLTSGADHVAISWDSVADRAEPILLDLGGRRFRVTTDRALGTARAEVETDAAGGAPATWAAVPILRCYWFAWFAFHPKTAVWSPPEPVSPK